MENLPVAPEPDIATTTIWVSTYEDEEFIQYSIYECFRNGDLWLRPWFRIRNTKPFEVDDENPVLPPSWNSVQRCHKMPFKVVYGPEPLTLLEKNKPRWRKEREWFVPVQTVLNRQQLLVGLAAFMNAEQAKVGCYNNYYF